MELQVLSGLSRTIARSKPAIFIEVDDHNSADFGNWAESSGYTSVYAIRKYRTQVNHLLVPNADAPEMKLKLAEISDKEL